MDAWAARKFSPGVRGWTDLLYRRCFPLEVFPRRAGVDRRGRSDRCSQRRFPPACGGGPFALQWDRRRRQFSPGVRGWTEIWIDRQIVRGVFPRRAGVDRPGSPGRRHRGRFPPACGGGPRYGLIGRLFVAFSPGVRGWTGRDRQAAAIGDVFPRRAGVDRKAGGGSRSLAGFPPACGGGPYCCIWCAMN